MGVSSFLHGAERTIPLFLLIGYKPDGSFLYSVSVCYVIKGVFFFVFGKKGTVLSVQPGYGERF